MDWRWHLRVPAVICITALACSLAAQTVQVPPLAVPDQNLPSLNAGIDIRIPLRATGGLPPYQWTLTSGGLPPGLNLDPAGSLFGRPSRPGTYEFTLTVTDSARPARTVTKDFKSQVTAALLLEWLNPPAVQGEQIVG